MRRARVCGLCSHLRLTVNELEPFRLYGPEKPFFEKTWKLPDIEKVK